LLDHPGDDTMSTWARDCSARLGFEQEPLVVGSGCSTGADAIGLAAALLDSHAVDAALVVAADIVTDGKRLAHSLLGTMTSETARPFDQVRSGMLLGEAAGALVMLRKNDCPAARRELIGVGAANDADGLTTPDSSGLSVRLAIERAMHGAGLAPRDIALYLAHGTGTELNDSLEATIIAELFADHQDLTVMGVKGAIGHTLGACGVVEFLLMLEALDRGLATPTPGLEKPIAGIAERFAGLGGRQIKQCCGASNWGSAASTRR
jgi:3-oxoacyl-[acyl-carrier-protein] synthase II